MQETYNKIFELMARMDDRYDMAHCLDQVITGKVLITDLMRLEKEQFLHVYRFRAESPKFQISINEVIENFLKSNQTEIWLLDITTLEKSYLIFVDAKIETIYGVIFSARTYNEISEMIKTWGKQGIPSSHHSFNKGVLE